MNKKYLVTRYGKIKLNEIKIRNIPDKPRLKLSNYLVKLYDKEIDNKSNPILIIKNKYKTPIMNNLNSYSKENLNNLFKNVKYFSVKGSNHKIKLPKFLNPKLSYLIGYLYGDGGLKDIRRSYKKFGKYEHKIIVGDEFKTQINDIIKPLFEDLFGLNLPLRDKIDKGENIYYLNPTSKVIYRFLVKVFEFREGPKHDLKIPKLILKNKENLKWFLRGFIDADGDVKATEHYSHKLPQPRIKIRISDKGLIDELKKHFNKEFNLGLTGPYSDKERNFYIQGAKGSMVKAYKQKIFIHPIKAWRLENFVGRVAQKHFKNVEQPGRAYIPKV